MIAVIADIHGNQWALEAVLRELDRLAPQQVVVAGDLAFGGPRPGECVELIRRRGYPAIRGNTDEWLMSPSGAPAQLVGAVAWCRARLSVEDRRFLAALPFLWRYQHPAGDVVIVHAAPWSIAETIAPDAPEPLVSRVFTEARAPVVVYGHIHIAHVRWVAEQLLVNPGSVGLPADGDPRASFAILALNEGRWQADLRRALYDVESAIQASRHSDNPEGLNWARRLEMAGLSP